QRGVVSGLVLKGSHRRREARSRKIEPRRLQLRVLLESMERLVAPNPRLLEPAERHRDVIGVIAIDEYRASPQRLCRTVRDGDVTGPYSSHETVDDVIGDLDRFIDRLKRDRGQDGPEDLLPGNRHARPDTIEDRGLDEVSAAVLAHTPA